MLGHRNDLASSFVSSEMREIPPAPPVPGQRVPVWTGQTELITNNPRLPGPVLVVTTDLFQANRLYYSRTCPAALYGAVIRTGIWPLQLLRRLHRTPGRTQTSPSPNNQIFVILRLPRSTSPLWCGFKPCNCSHWEYFRNTLLHSPIRKAVRYWTKTRRGVIC